MSDGYFCIWKEENGIDTDGVYKTACDNIFTIMEGNPKNNGFKYCPYCAGFITEFLKEETK